MKKTNLIVLLLAFIAVFSQNATAAEYIWTGWADYSSIPEADRPTGIDDVIIDDFASLTLDADVVFKSLTVKGGGQCIVNESIILMLSGDLNVDGVFIATKSNLFIKGSVVITGSPNTIMQNCVIDVKNKFTVNDGSTVNISGSSLDGVRPQGCLSCITGLPAAVPISGYSIAFSLLLIAGFSMFNIRKKIS